MFWWFRRNFLYVVPRRLFSSCMQCHVLFICGLRSCQLVDFWADQGRIYSHGAPPGQPGQSKYGPCRVVISKTSVQFSQLESIRRVGGWYEIAASLGVKLWSSRRPVRAWTRKLRYLRRWKPLPDNDWWTHSRLRSFSACWSELQSVWISNSAIVTCSYELCVYMFNKSNCQSKPRLKWLHTRDNIFYIHD
jgi:hypothetical protein